MVRYRRCHPGSLSTTIRGKFHPAIPFIQLTKEISAGVTVPELHASSRRAAQEVGLHFEIIHHNGQEGQHQIDLFVPCTTAK
jgi:hypothetical protein